MFTTCMLCVCLHIAKMVGPYPRCGRPVGPVASDVVAAVSVHRHHIRGACPRLPDVSKYSKMFSRGFVKSCCTRTTKRANPC